MAEDGVTTSGYGTEYAWQVCAVGYSLVGDEVIPSNAKNTSLASDLKYSKIKLGVQWSKKIKNCAKI